MFLLKLMRKLGKLVRGGVMSRQIFLGALLGVLIGMMPGFNLSVVLAILLLLLLNAHVGIALMGLALGKICMYLLAPVTFHIGFAFIHSIGLEGLFRFLANAPVLALLDLHVYCLIGGIPVAVALGFGFAWIMNRAVNALRKGIVEASERSPKMQKLAENKIVALFIRIVFGKKADHEELLEQKPRLFRKAGVILAASVLVIVVLLEVILLDTIFAAGLKAGLATANGAEVNLEKADLSVAGGKVEIRGLQMTDVAKPTHNAVETEHVTADLDIKELLRKRFVITLLSASTVKFDTERAAPGEVYDPPEEKPTEEKTPGDYLEKAKTIRNYLRKLQKYLEKREARKKPEEEREKEQKSQLREAAKDRGYLGLSAQDLLAKHPTWVIQKVEVEGVAFPGVKEPQNLEGKNLSSHPEYVPEPMSLRMARGPEAPPTGLLEFNFHDPSLLHKVALSLSELDLGEGGGLTEDAPIAVKDGNANVDLEGRFSADEVDIPFTVDLSKLQAQGKSGKSVLGMDPETAQKVFENIDTLQLAGAIQGSLGSPRVVLDTEKTLASLKSALAEAGKQELMKRAGKQIDKATEEIKGKAGEQIKEGIGGLLGGKKEEKEKEGEEEDKPDEQKEEKDSPADKVKDLF